MLRVYDIKSNERLNLKISHNRLFRTTTFELIKYNEQYIPSTYIKIKCDKLFYYMLDIVDNIDLLKVANNILILYFHKKLFSVFDYPATTVIIKYYKTKGIAKEIKYNGKNIYYFDNMFIYLNDYKINVLNINFEKIEPELNIAVNSSGIITNCSYKIIEIKKLEFQKNLKMEYLFDVFY